MTAETKYKKKQFGGRAKIVFLLPILFLALTYVSGKTHAEEFDFDLSIGYVNSTETVSIPKHYGVNTARTAINPALHNNTSPILLNISNGTFDESSSQEIEVRIYYQTNSIYEDYQSDLIYEKTVAKAGTELKNGTSIELDGFIMSAPTIDEFIQNDGAERYYVGQVRVGGVTRQIIMFYGYDNFEPYATLIDENDKLFFDHSRTSGHLYRDRLSLSSKPLSADAINSGRATAITVGCSDEDATIGDNSIFDYIVYKREGQIGLESLPYYYASSDISDYTRIDSGTITGKDFKNYALDIPIPKNEYQQPMYYVFILQSNQVMKALVVELKPWSGAGIESYTTQSETAQMYLKNGRLLSSKSKLMIRLQGINFDNNEKYTIIPDPTGNNRGFTLLCKVGENPSLELEGNVIHPTENGEEIYCQSRWGHNFEKREFSGEELNSGTATIEIPYIEYAERYSDAFIIIDDNGNIYPGGTIDIAYKDVTELVKTSPDSGYSIEDDTNYIKNIEKQTIVQELVDNLLVHNSSNYVDIEGTTSQNERLSTGMSAKIKDEYNHVVMELKTIVVGDTDGDGDITANDLAKERQHLSGRRLLKGVYKIAGSASGDDEITPTDLARMRQDLSGKREMRQ